MDKADFRLTNLKNQLFEEKENNVSTLDSNNTFNKSNLEPVRVCVTGAGGNIGYSLVPFIASGLMLGENQPIILHLLEVPQGESSLKGLVLELEDSEFKLVKEIIATTKPEIAFKNIDIAIFVGAFPRLKGMDRKDLLSKNAGIFKESGIILNKLAKKTTKILVVGNPANTNCLILKHFCPDIPKENFTCLTRLDLNRANGQIAKKLNVNVSQVKNIIIWGNHSNTQYPDVNQGYITKDDKVFSIRSLVNDDDYLNNDFIKTVQLRGAAIIEARKLSSATSAAWASVCHIRDWWQGTKKGEFVSMGVISDGSYGIEKDLIYSFPVSISNGKYTIVKNLKIDEF